MPRYSRSSKKNVRDKSIKRRSKKRKMMKRRSNRRKSMKRRSMRRKSMRRKSMKRRSMKRGYHPKGISMHGGAVCLRQYQRRVEQSMAEAELARKNAAEQRLALAMLLSGRLAERVPGDTIPELLTKVAAFQKAAAAKKANMITQESPYFDQNWEECLYVIEGAKEAMGDTHTTGTGEWYEEMKSKWLDPESPDCLMGKYKQWVDIRKFLWEYYTDDGVNQGCCGANLPWLSDDSYDDY